MRYSSSGMALSHQLHALQLHWRLHESCHTSSFKHQVSGAKDCAKDIQASKRIFYRYDFWNLALHRVRNQKQTLSA